MNSKRETRIPFSELPTDLKSYFVKWFAVSFLCFALCWLIGFIANDIFDFAIISSPFLIWMCLFAYKLNKCLKGQYRLFRAVCLNVKKPELNVGTGNKTFFHLYGYSKMVVELKNEEKTQLEIDISNAFEVDKGSEITFFAEENSFQRKSDSLWYVVSPLCLKVEKIQAA